MPLSTNHLNFNNAKHYYYLVIYLSFFNLNFGKSKYHYHHRTTFKNACKKKRRQYVPRVALSRVKRERSRGSLRESRAILVSGSQNWDAKFNDNVRQADTSRLAIISGKKGITIGTTAGQATQGGHDKKREYNRRFSRSLHLDTSVQVSGITNVRAFSHSVHCSHCKY